MTTTDDLRALAESMERIARLAQGDKHNPAKDISRTQVSMWAAALRVIIAKADAAPRAAIAKAKATATH